MINHSGSEPTPYLSVVAVSRNDDHGGNLFERTNFFVQSLNQQCKRNNLDVELVLVDWNPPSDRPGLAESIKWPSPDNAAIDFRVITVPQNIHAHFASEAPLPLFQMIGKNVGIRRARGKFILATNIDIIFSDALMERLASHSLKNGVYYRTDRCDVPGSPLDTLTIDELPRWCMQHIFRQHRREGLYVRETGGGGGFAPWNTPLIPRILEGLKESYRAELGFSGISAATSWLLRKVVAKVLRATGSPILHTNACGDFTLMGKNEWGGLQGYPEWPKYSWHLDGILLHMARAYGITEESWPFPACSFHLDHGDGWTPQAHTALFDRLSGAGIPYISDTDLDRHIQQLTKSPQSFNLNGPGWGLAGVDLKEVSPLT
jgi:hypothetical protein